MLTKEKQKNKWKKLVKIMMVLQLIYILSVLLKYEYKNVSTLIVFELRK